ncbi:MAG: peptidylprolyl isomerase [Clostridia bacterium]|nr:peptidylprolyl isomerase [Clostridia bacterium]
MKRVLTLIMAVILAVGMLTGCGKNSDKATEQSINQTQDKANAEKAQKKADAIATIGEYYITPEVLDFYISATVDSVQQQTGSAPGWEEIVVSDGLTARDTVITQALEYARQDYSVILEAKEQNLYSEEDNKKFLDSYINAYFGGEESFNQMLQMYNYDYDAAVNSLLAMHAYESIIANLCPEDEAEAQFDETYRNGDYYVAKHILITFDTRSDENAALKEANVAYERAVNGEKFEDLIVELNEDPGEDPEIGYLFTDGEMVIEFENAVKGLKIGEISKPVRTDYGYHVIKRYDIPKEGDASYDDYIREMRVTIGSSYMTQEIYDELMSKYKMDIDDSKFSKIDLSKYTTETE